MLTATQRHVQNVTAKAIRFRRFHASRQTCSSGNFAVCFDIDGVLRRGKQVLPRAPEVLHNLSKQSVPHLFVTNGGGIPEDKRARLLEDLINQQTPSTKIKIEPEQMILSHTPMSALSNVYGDRRILLLGCRDETTVARSYGFNRTVTAQEFAAQHPGLYTFRKLPEPIDDPYAADPIEAIVVMHDPADWHLELQVCCDVLQGLDPVGEHFTHRLPVKHGCQIPIFNSNEDFVFSSEYPHPRFAQGAFLDCLEFLYNKVAPGSAPLHIERFGKPNKVTFDFAHQRLLQLAELRTGRPADPFDRIYMIGDNPEADIRGANRAGAPWISVLVRTGVFQGAQTDVEDQAHVVVDDVGAAYDYIMEQEIQNDYTC